MIDSLLLSPLAKRAWFELRKIKRCNERQLARVLGVSEAQTRLALEELSRAGLASRKRRRPAPGLRPDLLWAPTDVGVKR